MRTVWYSFIPVLLQLLVSELISALLGSRLDSAALSALSALIVLPFAVWMLRRDQLLRSSKTQKSRDGRSPLFFGRLLLCFFSGAAMNLLLSWLLYFLRLTASFSNEAQESLLGSALISQLVGPCLLVPIVEEMIFRGLTYKRMRTFLSAWPAVLISALLFALYHGNPIQMLYAFPMGVLLAWIDEKGESLLLPVSFHMGANLMTVLAAFFL